MLSVATRRAAFKQEGLMIALESCLNRKKLVFSVGFKLLSLPRDPGCALSWAPQKFAMVLKAPQRKMVWHEGQEDRNGRVGEMVSTVFCVVTDS